MTDDYKARIMQFRQILKVNFTLMKLGIINHKTEKFLQVLMNIKLWK